MNTPERNIRHHQDVEDEFRDTKPDCMKIHFFKPGGKWYCEEEVPILRSVEVNWNAGNFDAINTSIKQHLKGRLEGMTWVALANPHGFPIMGFVPSRQRA